MQQTLNGVVTRTGQNSFTVKMPGYEPLFVYIPCVPVTGTSAVGKKARVTFDATKVFSVVIE